MEHRPPPLVSRAKISPILDQEPQSFHGPPPGCHHRWRPPRMIGLHESMQPREGQQTASSRFDHVHLVGGRSMVQAQAGVGAPSVLLVGHVGFIGAPVPQRSSVLHMRQSLPATPALRQLPPVGVAVQHAE
eukprot:754583-Hanusia_phi.AAC.1